MLVIYNNFFYLNLFHLFLIFFHPINTVLLMFSVLFISFVFHVCFLPCVNCYGVLYYVFYSSFCKTLWSIVVVLKHFTNKASMVWHQKVSHY